MTDNTDVRNFLKRMANKSDVSIVSPQPAVRRARRRLQRTIAVGVLAAFIAVYGAVEAAQTLPRATTGPAKRPLSGAFAEVRGWIRAVAHRSSPSIRRTELPWCH